MQYYHEMKQEETDSESEDIRSSSSKTKGGIPSRDPTTLHTELVFQSAISGITASLPTTFQFDEINDTLQQVDENGTGMIWYRICY
jgi:hypothetical protein